ncbi:MAG: hypothetical protein ACYC1M_11600 [Armatimonadota bacterium]
MMLLTTPKPAIDAPTQNAICDWAFWGITRAKRCAVFTGVEVVVPSGAVNDE